MRKFIQKIALWALRETNYQFKFECDEIKIEVQPVGADGMGGLPSRYDFILKGKDKAPVFMNSISMVRYFSEKDIFDCPNPKTKGVRFSDENQVENLEKQYNNLVDAVKNNITFIIP